ncbi:hypothetical protein [Amycolatopsis taiwanensis]|uniref:hypothetical protein n=1 Tax=Amycolatopsis taiwanensis TaxID=342230 RepID=UPI0005C15B3B|nr:hypothetical protein [Amycolatopsis taiwanensis]
MSTPEPRPTPDPAQVQEHGGGQITTRPTPTRIDLAARWVRYHRAELAGVAGPAVLAATVSPWWAIGSGVAALLWAVHEHRARRGDNEEQS